ncbi:unnamed protein product [Zymoseptoria tritici ST99CH_3D1]|uniref:Uncharacterized protein n=1 Tax=Zymoseptoria tritici ST99CH_1E4 TaxID=1276532 RepID=A0A2H1FL30_ZYMTR|nr:unnamed protein product [Zymoseptoria tritici ST99CH_1E4]SMR44213.1 unnamed protein product [Zymoseptoria tritici ST99CH_3D1]
MFIQLITTTSQQHNRNHHTHHYIQSLHPKPKPKPAQIMYTSAVLTALVATAVAGDLVARQNPLRADLVRVVVNNATFSTEINSVPPFSETANGRLGPFGGVTLTLGDDIDDVTAPFRCQILNPAGEIIRVNRGNNTNKSTFSKGNNWTMASGFLEEIATIVCPVAAPPGE